MRHKFFLHTLEKIVQVTKNKNFKFDPAITFSIIFSLIIDQFFARCRSIKFLFRGFPFKGIQLGSNVKFKNIQNIKLGKNIKFSDYVHIDGLGFGKIHIDDRCSLGAFSRIVTSTSYSNLGDGIHLGTDVAIGEFSYIGGAGGVSIGSNSIIGQYLSIHPENHNHDNLDLLIRKQGVTRKGVSIGENVWIGAKVTILDGVTVGNGCIIAAGAVLTAENYPENTIIGGVPAKVLRYR
jgi:acetyltransferase-like isoleucine patch superfamily enzyme